MWVSAGEEKKDGEAEKEAVEGKVHDALCDRVEAGLEERLEYRIYHSARAGLGLGLGLGLRCCRHGWGACVGKGGRVWECNFVGVTDARPRLRPRGMILLSVREGRYCPFLHFLQIQIQGATQNAMQGNALYFFFFFLTPTRTNPRDHVEQRGEAGVSAHSAPGTAAFAYV